MSTDSKELTAHILQIRHAHHHIDLIRHLPRFEDVRDSMADIIEFDVRTGYKRPWGHDNLVALHAHCLLLLVRKEAEAARAAKD